MDFYRFVVTNFKIDHTRSIHEDTLHLSHTVHVDNDIVATNVLKLGNFNNGDYQTEHYVHGTDTLGITDLVINNPFSKVTFTFQLVNADHDSADTVAGRVVATADQLAGIGAGLAGAGASGAAAAAPATLGVSLALELFANVYAWLSVDCDGPVAVDQLSGPRYVVDAWADDDPTGTGTILRERHYPGTDSPEGCGANSDYTVTWLVQHWRGWSGVQDGAGNSLQSLVSIAAAAHHGAVHGFGVLPGGQVTHARTFTGGSWSVAPVGSFGLSELPVSAVSLADRLYVIGVKADQSVSVLAYTTDGGSWVTPVGSPPPAIRTVQAAAATAFGNRLHLVARDSSTGSLVMTSTSDLQLWESWVPLPASSLAPASPVAAARLADRLYVFGITDTKKPPLSSVVVGNSTADGVTWTGWQVIEGGARPEGMPPTDQPVDVTASHFEGRLYIASRWQPSGTDAAYVAVNFSSDGLNWSGWRQPQASTPNEFTPGAAPGIAGGGNHLYVFAVDADSSGPAPVSVH